MNLFCSTERSRPCPEDYKLEKLAEDYLLIGGYPEHVLNPSSEYMVNLLDDILMRDLIRLYPDQAGGSP